MTPSMSTSELNQADVEAALKRLQMLRNEIATTKKEAAPLEANLALAYQEFQTVVGPLRRETIRLQSETDNLKRQIEGTHLDQDEADWSQVSNDEYSQSLGETSAVQESIDPDALEKDILLEHIFRVLDPMVNDEDEALLADLQGLCNNPAASLADVLAELPWGPVWKVRSPHETIAAQYRRLQAWEHSLSGQLTGLKRLNESLRKDSRFGLWQQKQKGPEAWQSFLERASEQQQDYNEQLEAELEELRAEWARIINIT